MKFDMAGKIKDREIRALVSMVDDPDPKVFREISGKILHYGQDAIPFLEQCIEQMDDEALRHRVERLMKDIRYHTILQALRKLVLKDDPGELFQAWIWVSRLHYPDIDRAAVEVEIEAIRKDAWLEMNENLTALEQVKVFNHVFYGVHRFSGNMDHFHDPDNSFINRVLNTRKGNPLSVGLIYMLVARSLNMPIMGINLPEHFVLAYMGETIDAESLQMQYDKPLFYINAFSNGDMFSAKEINDFLDKLDLEPLPVFFEACSNREIILRMLNNLVISYDHAGEEEKKADIAAIRDKLQ